MPVSRRGFLIAGAAPLFAQRRAAPPTRPNIVLLLAEYLPAHALGCYGNKEIRTPNIDLLARGGTRFTYHAACAPAPAPCRASLLTGLVPRQHGLQEGQTVAPPALAKAAMISDLLSSAGYNCGFAGHWGLGDDAKPQPGFRYWRPGAGQPSRNVVQFLEEQKAEQPFFLVASYPVPREPYEGLPQKFLDMYASVRFDSVGWLPPAPNAASGKEYLKDIVGSLRKCAAAISTLDEQLPAVVAALNARKLRDQTLVVFTSSCGHLMGRHGLWGAGRASDPINMYEESVMTPMIWNWPGMVPVEGVRPELINGDDLLPSLCEVAGVKAPEGRALAGRSYWLSATNRPYPKKEPWRNLVFSELGNTEMIRDSRFKVLVRNGGKGPNELYDLRKDSFESTNQYENGEFISMRTELMQELVKWRKTYS